MREKIEQAVKAALPGVAFVVERPRALEHGDYSTNAALVGKVDPNELSSKLRSLLSSNEVEKIEVVGKFINFFLSREELTPKEQKIPQLYAGKKILLEKSAPNLFKPFHVGHLLNLSVGESLSRLMRALGGEVVDVAYPSDISLGVAKAVWVGLKEGVEPSDVHTLGKWYVEGTKIYDENEQAKAEIIKINQQLNDEEAGPALELYKKGRELNLAYFKDITTRLGSAFSDYFFESEAGKIGKDIVQSHIGSVFEKSDGAVVFPGEKYGLHTRVFLTSLGLAIYEAKDIGLLKLKFDKYNPDLSLVITDVEQKQYFEVVKKAAELIEPRWAQHSTYWQHGRMRFVGGKISSRYGNVPLAEDMIEAVKERIRAKFGESGKFADDKEKGERITEEVALGAIKYSFLKSSSGHNIVFDFDQAVAFEGGSGPYLQYALVRARSLLKKASGATVAQFVTPQSSTLERVLIHFSEVVARAAGEMEPHYVVTYLTELSSAFNGWYATERAIVDGVIAGHTLSLIKATEHTLAQGLALLGIPTPEEM
ncbi:arginine--tRNA ligase [Candidatus Kaiserbacteria bacterium RIFCSPLOWO2_01_FULL_54_20]|uniref:Arginine--tRNA ligase n=1 Tax=Candidatus Kaiserbacteria bacterium RIFCSPLOWO2_01_FULL_54_20 TaxID=1798513 RepID=A0A1F6EKG0_9BACT|nr:MAG: arginine--tRNA ligase [Candidatus Kaiserbacteria bacterium RIFCSPLOWO2_01_FULL_54_20]